VVSVWATNTQAAAVSAVTGGPAAGKVTFGRTGSLINPLTINISAGGTAVAGTDYAGLPNTVTFLSGTSAVSDPITPMQNPAATADTTVTVTALPGDGYTLGTVNNATVTIAPVPALPEFIGAPSVTATAGAPFRYQLEATSGASGYKAAGLPAGLSIDPVTGLISGTATLAGTANVLVSATNANGSGAASLEITIMDSFSAWRQQTFSASERADSAISGETATPAHDGIPNLMKYALGLAPKTSGLAGLPVQATVSSYGDTYQTLTYSYSALAADVSYIVEVSDDLKSWYSGDGYTLPLSVTADPDGLTNTCTVEDEIPVGSTGPQFMRLRVVGP
jgi:hypothetical protein